MARLSLLLMWLTAAQPGTLTLSSPAFANNGPLPVEYTGYGAFTSPPLAWTGAPKGTRQFVLIVEDTDAPLASLSVHWLIYNIPATAASLPATPPNKAAKTHPAPIAGARLGRNAMKWLGYLPPRPFAATGVHHYRFTLYAVGTELTLAEGATRADVLAAVNGHVLAEATLVAVFERKEP